MTGKRVTKMGPKSPIWTIQDVADYLGTSVDSIRRWYMDSYKPRKGAKDFRKLERFMIGGMWRWHADEVRAFV